MLRLLDVALQSNTRSSDLYKQNKETRHMRLYLTSASFNQTPDLICSRNNGWKESGAEEVPGGEIRDPEIIWCREIGTPLAQHLSRKVHKILRVGLFQLDSRGISVRTSVLLPPFPHRPLCTCSCYCSTRLQFSKQTNSISHTSAPIMVYIQMFSDFRKYSTCTLDHCFQQFA